MRLAGDASAVVRAVNEFFGQLDFELEPVAALRREAVLTLRRRGWTLQQISEETGLSVSRVGQISRRGGITGRVAAE